MKGKLKKVWEFVKEHKAEVALITLGVVGTGVTIALATRKPTTSKLLTLECVEPEVVDIGCGKAEIMAKSDQYVELWVNEAVTLDDLGTMGESIAKAFPEIPEHHDKVQVMVNVYGLNKTE